MHESIVHRAPEQTYEKMSMRKLRSAASDEGKDPEGIRSPKAKATRSTKQKTPEIRFRQEVIGKELVNMPVPRAEVRSPIRYVQYHHQIWCQFINRIST